METGVGASEQKHGGNGGRSGDGAGTRTETGVKTRGLTQDGNGDAGGDGKESTSGNENGDGDGNRDGSEDVDKDGIEKSGGKAKKCKKPHKSCRRVVGNGGDLGGNEKKRQKRQRKGWFSSGLPRRYKEKKNSRERSTGLSGL